MPLERKVHLSGEEAAWLADKIVGCNQYGSDAARMLRRLSMVEQQRDELLVALKGIQSMMGYEWLREEFNEARDAIAKADLHNEVS